MKKNSVKKIIFFMSLTILFFNIGICKLSASEAKCYYPVSAAGTYLQMQIVDDEFLADISGSYNSYYKIGENDFTKANFITEEGKYKCPDKVWYSMSSSGSSRSISLSFSREENKKQNKFITIDIDKSIVINDESISGGNSVEYTNTCQYDQHFLMFNQEKFDIQLSNNYNISTIYFTIDDIKKLNYQCPNKLYFICTSRGGNFCAVSLNNEGSGNYINLTTSEVPNADDLTIINDEQGNLSEEEGNLNKLKPWEQGCGMFGDPDNPDSMISIIQEIFNYFKFGAPILVIIFGILDFTKSIMNSDNDALLKAGKSFGKRLAAAVLLFLLPLILNFILNWFNEITWDPLCGIK